jgi:hypothetical protein
MTKGLGKEQKSILFPSRARKRKPNEVIKEASKATRLKT